MSNGVLAYTQRDELTSGVVVRPAGGGDVAFNGRLPSLDGSVLAYESADGVRVVRWRSREEIRRAPNATRPALSWPWLAYRVRHVRRRT